MALTARQQRFVDEYLVDLNATQAAVRAGYSAHTANEIGAENLAKPSIRAAVDAALAARSERTQVTADRVIRGLLREAEYFGEDASHSARVAAWGWLGKHLGMFVDRVQVEGEVKAVTEVVVRTREEAAALLPLSEQAPPSP